MDHRSTTQTLPYAAGSVWWLFDRAWAVLAGIAPPWSVVPPLIFSLAALVSAITAHRKTVHEIRRNEG